LTDYTSVSQSKRI